MWSGVLTLPTDLLIHRQTGEEVVPLRVSLDQKHRQTATELIELFQQYRGQTQGDLDRHLRELEGDSTDYKFRRGLVHLLRSDAFSTFEAVSPLEPQALRERVFELAAATVPSPRSTEQTLKELALVLSQELDREVQPDHIRAGLYADLDENKILTQFEAPTPEALLHRYNLAQVQGVFYRASQVVLNAHRNDPGEYKLLFRYLKLFQLMSYVEGDADHGFTLTIDGPTSLFKESTSYGAKMGLMIPALLHVTKWSLTASLLRKDAYNKTVRPGRFTLNSDCGLVSHYPPGKTYDSLLEEAFVDRWQKLKTDWQLEREVDLIPIPGSVMIPDFRLVHPDGRVFLLEIVGYWRPEYLRKKFAQVQRSGCKTLILAISERLNLDKAGVKVSDLEVPIVWFKDKLSPKPILSILETL